MNGRTLTERLAAIATAPDSADLAELLGVAPGALSFGPDGLTVDGETISLPAAWRALHLDPPAAVGDRRTVTIGDLCPTNSPS
jgi:hypothetical protein